MSSDTTLKSPSEVRMMPAKDEGATKPVATQPVSGTPWSVVWTNDDKYFFFNATTKQSIWSIPEDIQRLPILKVLLAAPPGKRRMDGPSQRGDAGSDLPYPKRVKCVM